MAHTLPNELNDFLATTSYHLQPLLGGTTCSTWRIDANGNRYVYKSLAKAPSGFFQQEKIGLEYLANTQCFKTPSIHLATDNFILMDYIEPNGSTDWHQMGEQLANLHRVADTCYGFAENTFLASIIQNNAWQTNWVDFYRQQRLMPLLDHPLFNAHDRKCWQNLLSKLDHYLDNSEPPALIHGDLWYTNIIFAKDGIYLIDPATYYAPREMEIAYLEFVGDANIELLQAYQATYPLSPDYAERKNLYLLYPYLVHLHLYGDLYLPGIRDLLKYYA